MRERFRTGPPQLRQAYMRLLLESVVVDTDQIILTGSTSILERLAGSEPSCAAPEVLSFAQEWRAVVVEGENWQVSISAGSLPSIAHKRSG